MTPFQLRQAGLVLRAGGVIAYPTEGVYGLGCEPAEAAAVARVLALKGRPPDRGLIVIAARWEQVAGWVDASPAQIERARADWPGPVTWLLPAAPGVPPWITGGRDAVAVRVTAHPVAAALSLGYGGPLVSTSANRSGRPPARTALAVRRAFGPALDCVVSGAVERGAGPSEIRDARSGRVLRAAARRTAAS